MAEIPIEVLAMIFERLPVSQLSECRLVSKKWLFTIDRVMSFDCLVVYKDILPVNRTFFHTDERVSLRYCIQVDEFNNESEFKKSIYRRFKRICYSDQLKQFAWVYSKDVDYNFFAFHHLLSFPLKKWSEKGANVTMMANFLNQLEELHLSNVLIKGHCKLSLPNLKTLKSGEHHGELIIDAPQLTNLSVLTFGNITLVHPQTIEMLDVHYETIFSSGLFDRPQSFLIGLTGLKCMKVDTQWRSCHEFIRELIEPLNGRLRQLHLLSLYYLNRELYQALQELERKSDQICIYLNGIQMACLRDSGLIRANQNGENPQNELIRGGLDRRRQMNFFVANNSALSETLPFYHLNYNLLEELQETEFNLFTAKRLNKLEVVTVNGQLRDEQAFGKWLSESSTLFHVQFERSAGLSQEFYSNTLTASCQNLQCLSIFDTPADFSFLLKFKYLYRVDLASSDYDLVLLLFPNLAYLRLLAFYGFEGEASKQSLDVVKTETYDLYDGHFKDTDVISERFVPVNQFESFEDLADFMRGFTGF